MMRRLLPTLFRLAIIVLALIVGFYAGLRADARAHPDLPPNTDTAFRAFELPDPTLPPTCCQADDSPEQPIYATSNLGLVDVAAAPGASASPQPSDTAAPSERARRSSHRQLTGKASWHATGRDGPYAAACRPLRKAIGPDWRGQSVIVEWRGRWLGVVLNDWCRSKTKMIDLSDEVFAYFAPLRRGVLRGVAVGWR